MEFSKNKIIIFMESALVSILFFLLELYFINGTDNIARKIFQILLIIIFLFIVLALIRHELKYRIILDDYKLQIHKESIIVNEDIIIDFDSIVTIKRNDNSSVINEIFIASRYKHVKIRLTKIGKYKVFLKELIDKTKDNEKIKVDNKILDLIK